MPSFTQAEWPSPLAGYENLSPLPSEKTPKGIYVNPQTGINSKAYSVFPAPIDNGESGGFDVHVYYFQSNKDQTRYAQELWERVRREFPELGVRELWTEPAGPHPVATFEVDLMNPTQFGAFVPWIAVNRGTLSVLVHPNTDTSGMDPTREAQEAIRDHTDRALWMGAPVPLDTSFFDRQAARVMARRAQKQSAKS